ncbi:BQ2448_2357 [Microbotryum intermedium]|uniref:BQ2448_2357 protein n=1 Tax=Microbotryum intermedium TaxID=269621 RepID=A0A238F865_9BASI|nr:BQ2448_2357 [Microbotryum intermedium]
MPVARRKASPYTNQAMQARAEEERRLEARLEAKAPLVRHNFAMWGKEGEIRAINIRGTAAKKQQMKRSQTVADLSNPSDKLVDAKRVVVKGKNRAGRADVTEGRRVTMNLFIILPPISCFPFYPTEKLDGSRQ